MFTVLVMRRTRFMTPNSLSVVKVELGVKSAVGEVHQCLFNKEKYVTDQLMIFKGYIGDWSCDRCDVCSASAAFAALAAAGCDVCCRAPKHMKKQRRACE
jgi:hypothetical protein